MAGEAIMLAKHGLFPKKLNYPCVVYPKLDGSAADVYGHDKWILSRTRQHEEIMSIGHIKDWLYGRIKPGEHLIGELFIPGKDFKYIGGKARQHDTCHELELHVYDFYREGSESADYHTRMLQAMESVLWELLEPHDEAPVKLIQAIGRANDWEELNKIIDAYLEENPDAEGVVVRNLTGPDSGYQAGKRSYGLQTKKHTETLDLPIVSVEEAIDAKTGLGKAMAGRINVRYRDSVVGIGPGKLTHAERTELWMEEAAYIGRIVEVAYKPDASYDALREPRFYRWRPDKD